LDVPPVITLLLVQLQWLWYCPFYRLHIRATNYWILVRFVFTLDVLSCRLEEEPRLVGSEIFPLVVTLRVGLLCVQHSANFADESQKVSTVARHTPDMFAQ